MQSAYAAQAVDVAFDDPNLIADAGLVPVVALAERVGLPELVLDHLAIVDAANSAGANPHAKVMSLLAGMALERTRSRTSTGCGMPGTAGCSPRCGHPPRSGRS